MVFGIRRKKNILTYNILLHQIGLLPALSTDIRGDVPQRGLDLAKLVLHSLGEVRIVVKERRSADPLRALAAFLEQLVALSDIVQVGNGILGADGEDESE